MFTVEKNNQKNNREVYTNKINKIKCKKNVCKRFENFSYL